MRLTASHLSAALVVTIVALFTYGGAPAATSQAPSGPQTAKEIVAAFDALFTGPRSGQRAVHAKGILIEGTFTPSPFASALSTAPHFAVPVPVSVRFSNFPGDPSVEDGDEAASPRGMAIKFMLPDGGDTDIVAHSYNGFPAGTPEGFLAFLQAVASPSAAIRDAYLAAHQEARAFVEAPKPAPASYATERFFGVNAFRFTNAAGLSRFGRYRLEPVAGLAHLTPSQAAWAQGNFLTDELSRRLAAGPAEFRLLVQIAASNDGISDGSIAWPMERETIEAGIIRPTRFSKDGKEQQSTLLFTPLNLTRGIAPSADPLLVARTRTYRISHDRRQPHVGTAIDKVPTAE